MPMIGIFSPLLSVKNFALAILNIAVVFNNGNSLVEF